MVSIAFVFVGSLPALRGTQTDKPVGMRRNRWMYGRNTQGESKLPAERWRDRVWKSERKWLYKQYVAKKKRRLLEVVERNGQKLAPYCLSCTHMITESKKYSVLAFRNVLRLFPTQRRIHCLFWLENGWLCCWHLWFSLNQQWRMLADEFSLWLWEQPMSLTNY